MDSPDCKIVPAYSRKDYPRFRDYSKDAMPKTWDDWAKVFSECGSEIYRNQDVAIRYRRINPRKFEAWLEAEGLRPTEATRCQYAARLDAESRTKQRHARAGDDLREVSYLNEATIRFIERAVATLRRIESALGLR